MIFLEEHKGAVIDAALKANLPVLLVGETGVGKTTIIADIASRRGYELVRISLNDQIGREDLIGKFTLHEGSTKWVDGPVLDAMKTGKWVVLDELNSARPEVLFALHSITDHSRSIVVNENENEKVVAHKYFKLFGAINPDSYRGTKVLNQAFMSRFVVVEIPVLEKNKEYELLRAKTKIGEKEASFLIDLATYMRKSYTEGEIIYFCSTRDLITAATLVNAGVNIQLAVDSAIANKLNNEDLMFLQKSGIVSKFQFDPKTQESYEDLKKKTEEKKKELNDISKKLDDISKKMDITTKDLTIVQSQLHAERTVLEVVNMDIQKARTDLEKIKKATDEQKKQFAKEYIKTTLA